MHMKNEIEFLELHDYFTILSKTLFDFSVTFSVTATSTCELVWKGLP